ncbi:MAG: efflux RND transporter periplasmic adaptor subunit [Candidatus Hydrogenedentes bacterium]|nr:efflux RND transporter periplasmic adaptor subunit [Candidatus Hydrogenedentota bacterium]
MNRNRFTLFGYRSICATTFLFLLAIFAAAVFYTKLHTVHAAEEAAAEETVPEGVVPFTDEQIEKYGVIIATASGGTLHNYIALSGEIRLNADKVAHVTLPVKGYAQEIRKSLGDAVTQGEVLATFKSRELAEARAAYVAAQARLGIAQTKLKREKSLFEQKVSPQQDYLDAERDVAETSISMQAAEQQLRTLGYEDADFKSIGKQSKDAYTRFVLQSPMAGTIIEKHISLGELVAADTTVFIVADTSGVWADFTVTQDDLARVRVGQKIAVVTDAGNAPTDATVSYVGPVMNSDTRSALARVVMDNAKGDRVPGQFVTGKILVDSYDAAVLVPPSAVQSVDGVPSVFVKVEGGFETRPIKTGRSTDDGLEVVSGLQAGETYANTNTFVIKAQLGKGEAGHEEE